MYSIQSTYESGQTTVANAMCPDHSALQAECNEFNNLPYYRKVQLSLNAYDLLISKSVILRA